MILFYNIQQTTNCVTPVSELISTDNWITIYTIINGHLVNGDYHEDLACSNNVQRFIIYNEAAVTSIIAAIK